MKRDTFLLIAALVPLAFSLVMMFAPGKMLSTSLVVEADLQTHAVARWVGFGVFSMGIITLLARHDKGSIALRSIMTGNVVFHLLGLFFDTSDYFTGVMTFSGLITGLIPHALLIMGFVYFLLKLPKSQL